MDIALFSRLPRRNENLVAVVEAKKKGKSCLTAFSQALDYANDKGKNACNRLIVSDGLRYGVYIRKGDDYNLYAYVNLNRVQERLPHS